jgi:phytoene synthase
MDVDGARYETIDDTLRYCYHVAGVVGLMMASIMGAKEAKGARPRLRPGPGLPADEHRARHRRRCRVGRCYLPAQWLREAGIPLDEIAQPQHRAALARVAARLVDHAEPYYDSRSTALRALPLRSAWAIATARNVYRQIGIEVKGAAPHAWDERVGTSKATKLKLLAKGGVEALLSRLRPARARPAGLWQRPAERAAAPRHAAPATGA